MSAEVWLDIKGIMAAIHAGGQDALEETGERIAAEAKRRAPIRKVFKEAKGYRRKFRPISDEERNIAMALSKQYYASSGGTPDERAFKLRRSLAHLRYYARAEIPRRGSANSVGRSMKARQLGTIKEGRFQGNGSAVKIRGTRGYEPSDEFRQKLSARGAYEVRTGRAIHIQPSATGQSSRVQIGGALKASIGAGPVLQTGKGQEIEVEAAIRYAKYVEFPTIRTAAQPFLLPALKGEQSKFPHTVAAAIQRRLGGR